MCVHTCKTYTGMCMSLSLTCVDMCVHMCKPVHPCFHKHTHVCEWCLSIQRLGRVHTGLCTVVTSPMVDLIFSFFYVLISSMETGVVALGN